MLVTVISVPHPDSRVKLQHSTAVVIDVLRASSTILEALSNGAKNIIPVSEPDQAIQLKSQYPPRTVLLSGERMGIKIDGFDIGNCPADFSTDRIQNKSIIMCSTNGTKAIQYASLADYTFIGCFRNLKAVAEKIKSLPGNIYLIGSGKFGQFCLEDFVCAGGLIDILKNHIHPLELSDSALAAHLLYVHYQNDLGGMMNSTEHGKYLASIGYGADLIFCSQLNVSIYAPEFVNGIIQ